MGQPILHGYPDWGRQQSPSDVVLATSDSHVIVAATFLFSGFVGNAPYIQARGFADGVNRVRYELRWWADAAETIFIGRTSLTLNNNGGFNLSVPIQGPYVSILAEASAYPSTIIYRFIIGVVPRQEVAHDVSPPVLLANTGVAVGAGATVTRDSGTAQPGPAILSVDTALATWTARLQFGTLGGGFFTICSFRDTSLPGPRLVTLNGAWPRISFTNTTGAAGTVDLHLVSIVSGFG